jgi:hypothetical protein
MNARKFWLVVVLVCCVLLAAPLFAASPRIVRLSFVEGDVRLDRGAGNGPEEAILNSPVPEGARLITGKDGHAEVEFENGSALRLTGAGEVNFPQLTADDKGHLLTTVDVRTGTAYLDVKLEKHAQYRVAMHGGPAVALEHSSRLRFQVIDTQATVSVFDGEVAITEREHQVNVKKGETLTVDLAGNNAQYAVAKNLERLPADEWNNDREGVHQVQFARAENDNNYNAYGYNGYGAGDLLTYGGYTLVPGYGYMWRPYGYDASWDPFGYGAWSYYPSWGWTFISGYPWGWAPYRYGSWYNVPGYGWMWRPGYGRGWNAIPVVGNAPSSFRPLHPPKTGPGPTTIVGTPPPQGVNPTGMAAGQKVPAAQTPARRPEIMQPTRPHAHTPAKSVRIPADGARDTTVTPTQKPAPATPSATPAPEKPAPSASPSMSNPTAPDAKPASPPAAPAMHAPAALAVSPHVSEPAAVPHSSSSAGHVSAGVHK